MARPECLAGNTRGFAPRSANSAIQQFIARHDTAKHETARVRLASPLKVSVDGHMLTEQ
jgi:hypothetical protein